MSFHHIQDFSGHSGCRVMLCRDGNQPFIRKQSASPAYNERLKKQWMKQKLFSAEDVKTPQVLGVGFENDLFYFDMEYVDARTLAEYVDRLELDDILAFLDLLFHNLPLDRSARDPAAQELFAHKISAVAEFHWSFHKLPKNIHRELTLLIAREVLLKNVLDKTQSVHVLFTIYHIVLLNTLRILPYTRDDETRRYLHRTLAAIMRRIDEIKEYL